MKRRGVGQSGQSASNVMTKEDGRPRNILSASPPPQACASGATQVVKPRHSRDGERNGSAVNSRLMVCSAYPKILLTPAPTKPGEDLAKRGR